MQVEVSLVGRGIQVAAIVAALHHKLHLTITVDIGHGTVVQAVAADGSTVTVHNGLDGNLPKLVVPRLTLGSLAVLLRTLDDRYDPVGGRLRPAVILKV